jgi:hypothetical protein
MTASSTQSGRRILSQRRSVLVEADPAGALYYRPSTASVCQMEKGFFSLPLLLADRLHRTARKMLAVHFGRLPSKQAVDASCAHGHFSARLLREPCGRHPAVAAADPGRPNVSISRRIDRAALFFGHGRRRT